MFLVAVVVHLVVDKFGYIAINGYLRGALVALCGSNLCGFRAGEHVAGRCASTLVQGNLCVVVIVERPYFDGLVRGVGVAIGSRKGEGYFIVSFRIYILEGNAAYRFCGIQIALYGVVCALPVTGIPYFVGTVQRRLAVCRHLYIHFRIDIIAVVVIVVHIQV